jgi:excisionase family DNA binding protein
MKTLSIREVAGRLDVTTRAVHRWIHKGYFPGAYKLSPARNSPYRIPESDVVAFDIKRGRRIAEPQPETETR